MEGGNFVTEDVLNNQKGKNPIKDITTMTYNKIRHLELLRRFLDFKKQGKSLYKENWDEYLELLHYRGRLEDQAFWNNKELMENFIHDSIDMEQFEIAFSRLWWKTIKHSK